MLWNPAMVNAMALGDCGAAGRVRFPYLGCLDDLLILVLDFRNVEAAPYGRKVHAVPAIKRQRKMAIDTRAEAARADSTIESAPLGRVGICRAPEHVRDIE